MLTDAQLTKTTHEGNYVVSICHKREEAPRLHLTVQAITRAEAYAFGHEYALRILKFRKADYYLLVNKAVSHG